MQKPERRKIGVSGADTYGQIADKNYNIGLAAMEEYYEWRMGSLPDVEEIEKITKEELTHQDTFDDFNNPLIDKKDLMETLSKIIARKIAKRIGGSNEQTKQD